MSELLRDCVKEFGTTSNPAEGAYLLPDGKYLDFSAGFEGGRNLMHTDIKKCVSGALIRTGRGVERINPMHLFMKDTCSMRFGGGYGGDVHVDVVASCTPTTAQLESLRRALKEGTGVLWYSIYKPADIEFNSSGYLQICANNAEYMPQALIKFNEDIKRCKLER